MLHKVGVLLSLLVLIIMLSGCDYLISQSETPPAIEQISETRVFLSTYCTITIHGSDDYTLLDQAFELLEELEALLSMTIADSDIYRINHANGMPALVDSRTAEVILAGIEFGELSDGLFDITIGRLSHLWDFGNTQQIPDEAEIIEALETVNFRQVILDGNTVRLENPSAWIDLGAIAKGYIANELADFLIAHGVTSAFINLGGDITTIGNRQDGSPWRIAVRNPFGDADDWIGVMEVTNSSVAGSGTYERTFEYDGVHYHHILNPTTGMPTKSDIISATVVADRGMTAEGLSTIAILAGSNDVKYLFNNTPGFIGAVLVLDNEEVLIFGDIVFR